MTKSKDNSREVDGYVLANEAKVRRAIEGTVTREGRLEGGVGDADPELIRAKYDSMGGLILKDGKKVKTGAFWDFVKKAPREEPDVIYEHRTASGELVEFKGEEPIEVKAEKITRARKAKTE